MRDRLPTPGKENRVKITMDDGSVVEGVLSYADDATQEGSAYTKGNVLPDSVCESFDMDPNLTEPKDVFGYLGTVVPALLGDDCIVYLSVATSDGTPLPDVGVSATGTTEESYVTNSFGIVIARILAGMEAVFSLSDEFVDISYEPVTVHPAPGAVVSAELITETINFASITESKNIKISPSCTRVDLTVVGGGGCGSNYVGSKGNCPGASAAEVITVEDADIPLNIEIAVVVGAGGAIPGAAGGTSSIKEYSALGGAGGGATNGYKGASGIGGAGLTTQQNPQSGTASTVTGFVAFGTRDFFGGGGGAGGSHQYAAGLGGTPGGGKGGTAVSWSGKIIETKAEDGKTPGAGGGGAPFVYHLAENVGRGANGVVNLCLYHGEELA